MGGEKESGIMRLSSSSLRLSQTTGAAGTGVGCAAWAAADWAADRRLATAREKREVMLDLRPRTQPAGSVALLRARASVAWRASQKSEMLECGVNVNSCSWRYVCGRHLPRERRVWGI